MLDQVSAWAGYLPGNLTGQARWRCEFGWRLTMGRHRASGRVRCRLHARACASLRSRARAPHFETRAEWSHQLQRPPRRSAPAKQSGGLLAWLARTWLKRALAVYLNLTRSCILCRAVPRFGMTIRWESASSHGSPIAAQPESIRCQSVAWPLPLFRIRTAQPFPSNASPGSRLLPFNNPSVEAKHKMLHLPFVVITMMRA